MAKVTVVGSYIVALVIDTERLPTEGETIVGRNYQTTHGGKGSNMACCAARLGAESLFVGKIGDDEFGRRCEELLQAEGVSRNGLILTRSLPTAVGFIVTSSSGGNLIVIDPAACGDLSPADVDSKRELIEGSDVVLSPGEIPCETALHAARIAAARGVPAIYNPAPACDLRGQDLSCLFALTPNESEARVCLGLPPQAGIPPEELARQLLALGPKHVIITLGSEGSIWAAADGVRRIPALDVKVLDTVGAGDAFNAALAVGVGERMPMEDALALASAAASLSTEKRETIASYSDRRTVDGRAGEVRRSIVRWSAASC
jgi:ribokinase